MKFIISKLILMCISLIFVGLIFTSQCMAKIDPKTIDALWLFDEKDTLKDLSGNGHDGKQFGNPLKVNGVFGKALEFDGTSYIEISGYENPTKAITLTAWAKSATPAWNENGWIIERRDVFILHPVQASTDMAFCISNGGPWNLPMAWNSGQISPKDKDITKWHMYTATFDSATGEWKIYIDGEVASELDINKAEIVPGVGAVHIGWDNCCGGTRFGKGAADEVGILSVALSGDDIKAIYEKGFDMALAVESFSKLANTWADIKTQD